MSRISCNLTRDLFTVYLDDICSDESRELIEEHLQECEDCKQLLKSMKSKDDKEPSQKEQIRFFKKAQKYIDNRYKLVFFIALLFAATMGIYSEINYSDLPDVFILVIIPVLMSTYFLMQPVKKCKEKKYHLLQAVSVLVGALLIGLQFFVIQQLTILFHSPNDPRLCAIFTWEPMYIGPFLEKVYYCFILVEVALLILYYIIGKKLNCSFVVGQNASWTGIGLGLIFRYFLYRMDRLEGFINRNMIYISIILAEFLIVLLLNIIYVKWKSRKW